MASDASAQLPLGYYDASGHRPDIDGEPDSDDLGPPDAESRSYSGGTAGGRVGLTVIVVLAVLAILIILIAAISARSAAGSAGARNHPSLEARLAEKGWVVYFMKGCGHCEHQKQLLPGLFGETGTGAWVQCGDGGNCQGIQAFPFWKNSRTGDSRVGFQDMLSLQRMAGGPGA